MPGCRDRCTFHVENHSTGNLPREAQISLERAFSELKTGERAALGTQDLKNLADARRQLCIADHRGPDDDLLETCQHHYEEPEAALTIDQRYTILAEQKGTKAQQSARKWRLATLIVTIAGILASSTFAYLNYSKPSSSDLRARVQVLERERNALAEELDALRKKEQARTNESTIGGASP